MKRLAALLLLAASTSTFGSTLEIVILPQDYSPAEVAGFFPVVRGTGASCVYDTRRHGGTYGDCTSCCDNRKDELLALCALATATCGVVTVSTAAPLCILGGAGCAFAVYLERRTCVSACVDAFPVIKAARPRGGRYADQS